jgi:hypothetical protein
MRSDAHIVRAQCAQGQGFHWAFTLSVCFDNVVSAVDRLLPVGEDGARVRAPNTIQAQQLRLARKGSLLHLPALQFWRGPLMPNDQLMS